MIHFKPLTAIVSALLLAQPLCAMPIEFRIIQTTDVHGSFFPYDFINRKPQAGSLARVSTYVKQLREQYGDRLILLDAGDILQGQPTCYYCNYVKPEIPNVAAQVINYMGYDAQTIGNHDIETGHAVYDKWIGETRCPMLGANVIDTRTQQPYLKPYTIIERSGVRIAVIGMLTDAIPCWLGEELWQGLRFDDVVESSRQWVAYVKEHEHPDVIVGLFHCGLEGGIATDDYEENPTLRVAKNVPGFDVIFYGHDHRTHQQVVTSADGSETLLLNPSSNATYVCDATLRVEIDDNGKVTNKKLLGKLQSVRDLDIDDQFMQHFQASIDSTMTFVNRRIGTMTHTIYTRDAFFGSSSFCDLVHNLQLQITGADISFNAPLTFDSTIAEGDIHMSDMFNLYKYENLVCCLKMTGKEIRNYLEMSYDQWIATMRTPDDHIMLMDQRTNSKKEPYFVFRNLAFNFDSAAGINYEVDATKEKGSRIHILSMADGTPFDNDRWYNVVMNSYRANGGGELLTKGAGIPQDELTKRITYKSERDQRYYLTKAIEEAGNIDPKPNGNWRFVPDEWTKPALERDRKLLFRSAYADGE